MAFQINKNSLWNNMSKFEIFDLACLLVRKNEDYFLTKSKKKDKIKILKTF
jgi:hypothetical protein